MKRYYVYILLCTDNTYYTGVTNDLETRFLYHQNGQNPNSYTYTRRPVEIVYYTEFHDVNQAIAFEKQIKGWSRAKKKLSSMMNGTNYLISPRESFLVNNLVRKKSEDF